MEIADAIQIIQALADGVDPQTGEALPEDSPYQNPLTLRALFAAIRSLEFSRDAQTRQRRNSPKPSVPVKQEELGLTPQQETLYEMLKHWRNDKALQMSVPPFVVARNVHLKEMVTMPARYADDLLAIQGFGEKRTQAYGEDILALCAGSSDKQA